MVETILVTGCLYHPDQTIFIFTFQLQYIRLPSYETERNGMTNGPCPLVFACLQKSCRRFEHTYTIVHGSVNDFAIDRM